MTRDDVIKMLTLLKAAYPAFYSKMSSRDADDAISLWIEMFSGDDPRIIALAVKDCIETHDGYPPTIAAIKKCEKQLVKSVSDAPSVDELWVIFLKACSNGIYGACDEFNKLPPILQRFAGTPRALYDYATMDSETLNSVVRGQFFKRVQAMQEQAERNAMMPPQVREILREAASKMRFIDDTNEDTNTAKNRLRESTGDLGDPKKGSGEGNV